MALRSGPSIYQGTIFPTLEKWNKDWKNPDALFTQARMPPKQVLKIPRLVLNVRETLNLLPLKSRSRSYFKKNHSLVCQAQRSP